MKTKAKKTIKVDISDKAYNQIQELLNEMGDGETVEAFLSREMNNTSVFIELMGLDNF